MSRGFTSLLLVLTLGLGCACTPRPTSPAPSAATQPGPTAGSGSPASASGWTAGAETVEASAQGGFGHLFRHIRYSRATGTLSVEDSDPFASGREQLPPRVVRRSIVLTPNERASVEATLSRVQPDAAALARRCAPGRLPLALAGWG